MSEPRLMMATIRDAENEIHIECRFSDGQKFAAVKVDPYFPQLAQALVAYMNAELAPDDIELLGMQATVRP